MTTTSQSRTSIRTVVLLRPGEKKALQKMAKEEQVSSAEIIRRSINAYTQNSAQEEQNLSKMIAEMNTALDGALEAVRSARAEVAENIANIQKIRNSRS